jgi:MscS family membrane protein
MVSCRNFLALMAMIVLPQWDVIANDDPLAPPDTSSPRATLKSFLENFETAFRPLYDGKLDHAPYRTPAQIRTVRTLDTSEAPPSERKRLGAGGSILIYEILSRVELPPYEEVPDETAMDSLPADAPRRWRVPGTEIEILKVEEGPRTGEYLFSPSTVRLALDYYQRIRHRDYQPGAMKNLYERAAYGPGSKIPLHWIEELPSWMKAPLQRQAVWKWLAMVILVGIWTVLVILAHRWTRPRDTVYRHWRRSLLSFALMFLTYELRLFLEEQVLVIRPVFMVIDPLFVGLSYIFAAVGILNLGAGIVREIVKTPRIDATSIDAHMIGLVGRLVAWIGVLGLLLKAASDVGIPVAAVIASLGVGGLAVALAARPTLENLIAGITLYFDRPVRVGEWCQFDDVIAAVEEIGLRSTRLRRWDGNLISVPNAKFAEYPLDNYDDVRDVFIRRRLRLPLDTTPEQLRYLLVKLREMLIAHPKAKWPDVRLANFGESFLTVELRCYADTNGWTEYRAIREDVLLRAMEIIHEAGTALAMPAQTTYFARVQGSDEDRQRASEEQVKEWRENGELPFPGMTTQREQELADTLDFPPRGSALNPAKKRSSGAPDTD